MVDNKVFYENCIFDLCAFKDTKNSFCSALNLYATECRRNNVNVTWKNEFPECGKYRL